MKQPRLLSLDILRTIAILRMIQIHFIQNLSPSDSISATGYARYWMLGSIAPILFTFLVGLSLWLNFSAQILSGKDEAVLTKVIIRRGIFLFGFGLLFAFFVWLPEETFDWDILTLIGAAMLMLIPLRRASLSRLIGLACLSLLMTPFLRIAAHYDTYWATGTYHYKFLMKDIVFGFLFNGFFPIFPWISMPLVGYACGKYFFSDASGTRMNTWRMPAIGGGLFGLAIVTTVCSRYLPFLKIYTLKSGAYAVTATFMLGIVGIMLLAWWGLFHLFDKQRYALPGAVVLFFKRYSRFALTTYVIHQAIHLWPLQIAAIWQHQSNVWHYYGRVVNSVVALLLASVFVVGFYGILILWERHKGRYSLEWLLRWLSD